MKSQKVCGTLTYGSVKKGQNGEIYLIIGDQTLSLNADPSKATAMVLSRSHRGEISSETSVDEIPIQTLVDNPSFEDLEFSIENAKTQTELSEFEIRKTLIEINLQKLSSHDECKLSKEFFDSTRLYEFLSHPNIQPFFVEHSNTAVLTDLHELLFVDDAQFSLKVTIFFEKYSNMFANSKNGIWVFYGLWKLFSKDPIIKELPLSIKQKPLLFNVEYFVEREILFSQRRKKERIKFFILLSSIILSFFAIIFVLFFKKV